MNGILGDFREVLPMITVPLSYFWIEEGKPIFKTGSGTLFASGENIFIVTCHHVFEGFLLDKEKHPNMPLHFGGLAFLHPEELIIDQSQEVDLLTFRLKPGQVNLIGRSLHTEKSFYSPPTWPCESVREKEQIFVTGYLAQGLDAADSTRPILTFVAFTFPAGNPSRDQFMINGENAVSIDGTMAWKDVTKIGGVSGSGVFSRRDGRFEMVGVVKEGSKLDDQTVIYFATHSSFVRADGRIYKRGYDGLPDRESIKPV